MATTVNFTARIDADVKKQADELFSSLGMTLSTAFNIFVRQALREKGLPFRPSLEKPNQETMEAISEARAMMEHPEKYPSYSSAVELFKELGK